MAETLAKKQAETRGVKPADLLESSSVTSAAQKVGVGSHATVVHLLRQKDRTACEYCLYGMAKQVAASLGAIDENVKEVYFFDYDATPEDLCFCTGTHNTWLIHLLVWTQHKTAALNSLVAALDRALAHTFCDTIGTHGLTTLLDVQIIDDTDVQQRHGYGAFRAWVHQTPIQIWRR